MCQLIPKMTYKKVTLEGMHLLQWATMHHEFEVWASKPSIEIEIAADPVLSLLQERMISRDLNFTGSKLKEHRQNKRALNEEIKI